MEGRAHLGIFPWLGRACALAAVLIAILILRQDHAERRALTEQLDQQSLLRMRAVKSHVEDHMRSIWLCLRMISLDPKIASLSEGPYNHVQAIHETTFALHGLTEIYVAERDFDGKRHPFMSFYRDEDAALVDARHPLDRELEEYAIHVEHIRRFDNDERLRFLISGPIELCVGRPGIVCSVPIRVERDLVGIIAGMVKSEEISDILDVGTAGNEVILANSDIGFFTCRDTGTHTRDWFQEQFDRKGVDGFFQAQGLSFRVDNREAFWEVVDLPGETKWYTAYVYSPEEQLGASGVHGVYETWGGAGSVVMLGVLAMFLCHMIPQLAKARTQAENRATKLALSEERYRTLVENIDLGVTLIDADYHVVMTNSSQGRLLGKPCCEFIGKECFEQFEKREAVCPHCPGTRAMKTGMSAEAEAEGTRDDGSHLAVRIRAFPVLDANGKATGFIEVVEDITERKASEDRALSLRAELAHRTRVGTMGEMAAGLAHELDQPLTAIVTYIDACLERIRAGALDGDELLDDMKQVEGQAMRASGIIERLRVFVGTPRPQWATLCMNGIILEVVDLMEPEIMHRQVELHMELDDALPPLDADAVQIQQVLVNLIKNGIEAMADDDTDMRKLFVRTSTNADGLIECAIQDTGPGLGEDACTEAFAPFFTNKANGMGMGLPISRTIVEAHGGRLWAAANGDQGATFRFTLPVHHSEEALA